MGGRTVWNLQLVGFESLLLIQYQHRLPYNLYGVRERVFSATSVHMNEINLHRQVEPRFLWPLGRPVQLLLPLPPPSITDFIHAPAHQERPSREAEPDLLRSASCFKISKLGKGK